MHECVAMTSASLFKIKYIFFVDTLIQVFFKILKINDFRGDRSDISDKKGALAMTQVEHCA